METAKIPLPAGPAPARRVLVVDDNRDAADSLAIWLQMEGHEVDVAYGATEALALARARPPAIALLDIGLPIMDGYEAARRIRQRPDAQQILMIALTGWGQGDARRHTLAAGFDYHLIKPVELDEIMKLVNAWSGPARRPASA